MSKALTITIDIISDTICPWCFIGKRRLEYAISQFSKSSPTTIFEITWHPFYLSPPDAKIESKLGRYTEKFGSARVQQMLPYMQSVGSKEGIKFDYGGVIGPTSISHQVIQYTQTHEPSSTNDTIEALFRAYFEQQGNIFTKRTIVEILHAASVKLKFDDLETYLDDTQAGREVDEEAGRAQAMGVHGVPDFRIQGGRYTLNGAQEPDAFLQIFSALRDGES